MTFWHLTSYSDFPTYQSFHLFCDLNTELDLRRITNGFYGAFATSVACHQGMLTLQDKWFRPPFWDLLMLQFMRPNFPNLPWLYLTFHLEYPSVLSRFCLSIFNRDTKTKRSFVEEVHFCIIFKILLFFNSHWFKFGKSFMLWQYVLVLRN